MSIPTQQIKRPKIAVISPLRIDFPEIETITLKPKTARAKNSAGPNLSATFEIVGERNVITIAPIIPPQKEEKREIVKARALCPFWLIGNPSRTVAAAEGVPGV